MWIGIYSFTNEKEVDRPHISISFPLTPESLKDKKFKTIDEAANALGQSFSKENEIDAYDTYIKETDETKQNKVTQGVFTYITNEKAEDKFTIVPFQVVEENHEYKVVGTGISGTSHKYAENEKIINISQPLKNKDYSYNVTKYKEEVAKSDILFNLKKEKLYVGIMIDKDEE